MPLQPTCSNPGISRCISSPCLFPGARITGALVNGSNNAEINFERVSDPATPVTREQAYSDLMQKACEQFVSPEQAKKIVSGAKSSNGGYSSNFGFLGAQAINITELSKIPALASDPSLQSAKKKLTSLIDGYLKNPEQSIAACRIDKNGPFKAGEKVRKLIDAVLQQHKEAFNEVSGELNGKYLHDGLIKSLCERHGGFPDLQTAIDSSTNGNASHSAQSRLLAQLQKNIGQNDSAGLASFISNMLNQLDLHKPAESARPPQKSKVDHTQRGRAQDAGGNAHPAGSVTNRSGDVTGAPIDIKIEGVGPASSNEVSLALVAAINRIFDELVRVQDRELKYRDEQQRNVPDHRVGDTRRGSDYDQVSTQSPIIGSESHAGVEQPPVEVVDGSVERAQNGFSESNDISVNISESAPLPAASDSTAPQLGVVESESVETDAGSDSRVEDGIPVAPPMPRSGFPSVMDDSVRANMTSVMAELQQRLAGGLNLRASTDRVEPALDQRRDAVQSDASLAFSRGQPSRRRSESSNSSRSSFQAAFQLFESGMAVGRSASATVNTVDTTPLRTFDHRRDSNIDSRTVFPGGQTDFSSAVTEDDSTNDFLMDRLRQLKPIGTRNGSAQVAPRRSSISADTAFDVGRENMFVTVDRSSRATTPDIGTSADAMGMDQAQNLERSDSLSELSRLTSMVPLNLRPKAKVHAPVDTSNSFYGSLDSGSYRKDIAWQR